MHVHTCTMYTQAFPSEDVAPHAICWSGLLSVSSQRWKCSCLRRQWSWSVQHPCPGGRCDVHASVWVFFHIVLLRSDGTAVTCGANRSGQCNILALASGVFEPAATGAVCLSPQPLARCVLVTYTQVSAGNFHTVLLRGDGTAWACGDNRSGQCNIPALDQDGAKYTQVCGGSYHTVLLRGDGTALACGANGFGQCNIPALAQDGVFEPAATGAVSLSPQPLARCALVRYTQVSAGHFHTVLLRGDGTALACGDNRSGQCNIPALADGETYTQVSAGLFHTVLLRMDGTVVTCGANGRCQCNIPALDVENGETYTQVSAGLVHTVLLRNDGTAVAYGENGNGQCNIPVSRKGVCFAQIPLVGPDLVVQLFIEAIGDKFKAVCRDFGGEELASLIVPDNVILVKQSIEKLFKPGSRNLCVVLPDGRLASSQLTWQHVLSELPMLARSVASKRRRRV